MKKRMISNYTQKEHKLTEKRNLFPDLAGAGGFYIPGSRLDQEETEEDLTEMSVVLTPSTPPEPSRLSTETSFLVEGTIEEKRCYVQHTDV